MIYNTLHNIPVTLTITNVPDDWVLKDNGITIEWTIVDDYLLIPKFTFTFVHLTMDFFNTIG